MFTDQDWDEASVIAASLKEGNSDVFKELAIQLQRMVQDRDLDTVPHVLAVIVSLLPPEAQTRIRFGPH